MGGFGGSGRGAEKGEGHKMYQYWQMLLEVNIVIRVQPQCHAAHSMLTEVGEAEELQEDGGDESFYR